MRLRRRESDIEVQASSAAELSDAELARAIAASRGGIAADAEAELCRRYVRRVFHFGLRHLGADDRAHDLAQEVLLIVLEKLRAGELRDAERVGSFILGVARLVVRSTRRSVNRHQTRDSAVEQDVIPVEPAHPDPLAREHMARCLEKLREQQRTVVVLSFYAEQSTDAIASSLGLSSNNVRVIRHRGIATLRACLGLDDRGAVA